VTQASATLVNRVTTGNADSGRMKKLIIILAILLVVGAGATTHLYKKHKRPVHSPVLKATLPSSHPEEPAANIANIHDARIPVRTEKNQLSEPHDIAGQETFAWTSSNNTAMEEVLSQRQAKALHEQVGCTLITEASPQ
jgi:flagellar basal body-associated protein FliL